MVDSPLPMLLAKLCPCSNPYTVKWLFHVPVKQRTYLLSFFHISFGTPTDSLLYGIPGTDFGTSFAADSCCFWRSRPLRPQNSWCCSRRGPRPMALPHPFEVRDSNFVALSPPAVTATRSANSPCSMAHCQQIRQVEGWQQKTKTWSIQEIPVILSSVNVNTRSAVNKHISKLWHTWINNRVCVCVHRRAPVTVTARPEQAVQCPG